MSKARRALALLAFTTAAVAAVPGAAFATATGGGWDTPDGATLPVTAVGGVPTGLITVGWATDQEGFGGYDWTGTIAWGDGTTSPASFGAGGYNGSGNMLIQGDHTYARSGTYTVTFTGSDLDEGNFVTITPSVLTSGLQQVSETVLGASLGFVSAPGAVTPPSTTLTGLDEMTGQFGLPLDVSDATGSGNGWNVSLSATPFTSGSHQLGNLYETAPVSPTVCDTGATCTTATDVNNVVDTVTPLGFNTPTIVQNADAATGMGNQSLTPGFNLAVPANSYAGTYGSTWTVTLASAPIS